MERITSRQNPLCGHIKKLNSTRAYRREVGEFVIEGIKLVEEAIKGGGEIRTLVYAEAQPSLGLPNVREVEMPHDLFGSICDTKTPQGVLAICGLPAVQPPEQLSPGRYLVLDAVQDPGNVGTIWRTADAFGADGLVLLEGCADPFSPKTLRATMGACFRLPIWEIETKNLRSLLGRMPLYVTALREDSESVGNATLNHAAVVIGSEGRGVSQAVLDLSDKTLKIPMRERCESLNAAIAATVILWEGWRT